MDRLSDAVASRILTIVSAPIGYGKTVTARALAGLLGGKAFLIDVPPKPHDRRWLWDKFCSQLEERGMRLAAKQRQSGPPLTPERIHSFLKDAKLVDAPPPVVILDNYHHLSSPVMNVFLDVLAGTASPPFHVVLFSRTRPAMNPEESTAGGYAAFFGVEELCFSADEARRYFELYGITNADAAAKAWKISEGWPAAMWLSLKNWRDTGDIQQLPDIESLLANSVLADFSGTERAVLMRLSIMDAFTAEEAKALGGKKELSGILDFCERNSTLMYDGDTGRYRFHRFVRDFLSRELTANQTVNLPALYRRAGECQIRRGDLPSAFRLLVHAGKDGDLLRALDLFLMPEAAGKFTPLTGDIYNAVPSFPRKILARRPLAYLAFIRLYLLAGVRANPVSWWLMEAETEFVRPGEESRKLHERLKGEMAIISGLLAFNDMESMWRSFAEAHSYLRGPTHIHPRLLMWGFGCPHLSFICLREAGTFASLMNGAAAAGNMLTALSDGYGDGSADVFRMEFHLERAETDTLRHLLDSFERGKAGPDCLTATIHARFIRARLLLSEGRADEAIAALSDLRLRVAESELPCHSEGLTLALDYVHACLGRYDRMSELVRAGDILSPPVGAVQMHSFLLVVYGKALLMSGQYERLETMARNMPLRFMGYDSVLGRIHANIFEAICLQRLQGTREAMGALRSAVDLSRPDGIVFPFAEYGDLLTSLLRGARKECGDDPHVNRIQSFSESIRQHYIGGISRQRDSLTLREGEIMRMMVTGMTNSAIAKELGITSNAVKKALTLAYGKLGASNRIQAARLFTLYQER